MTEKKKEDFSWKSFPRFRIILKTYLSLQHFATKVGERSRSSSLARMKRDELELFSVSVTRAHIPHSIQIHVQEPTIVVKQRNDNNVITITMLKIITENIAPTTHTHTYTRRRNERTMTDDRSDKRNKISEKTEVLLLIAPRAMIAY